MLKQPNETFDSFIRGTCIGSDLDEQLHLSLLPSPFHGDISKADIFILLMNPGFTTSDYYAEENPEFRAASIANLKQKDIDPQFPYFSLNPKFAWGGAYQWIESRMRPILQEVSRRSNCTYYNALSKLSKRLAVIELFPYHSSNGGAIPGRVWKELPSVLTAKNFVQDDLSSSPEKPLILVARSHDKWDLPMNQVSHIIHCARTRVVTFNPVLDGDTGRAGRAILERLIH